MVISSRKGQKKRRPVTKQIKIEGQPDAGKEISVHREKVTLHWKGFESYIVM